MKVVDADGRTASFLRAGTRLGLRVMFSSEGTVAR